MSYLDRGFVGLRQEASFGGEVTGAEVFEGVYEDSITMDNNLKPVQRARTGRFTQSVAPGIVSASGRLSLPLVPEGLAPMLLKGAFGDVTSTKIAENAEAYQHVFSVQESPILPSFCIRSCFPLQTQLWHGCSVNALSLSMQTDDDVRLVTSILAQRPEASEEVAMACNSTAYPFVGTDVTLLFEDEMEVGVESFNVTFSNDIEVVKTMRGDRLSGPHYAQQFSISGAFNIEFISDLQRRILWGSRIATTPQLAIAPVHLSLNIKSRQTFADDRNYSFKLDLPQVYLESVPGAIRYTNDRVVQTVNFIPAYCAAAGKYADVTIVNGESAY